MQANPAHTIPDGTNFIDLLCCRTLMRTYIFFMTAPKTRSTNIHATFASLPRTWPDQARPNGYFWTVAKDSKWQPVHCLYDGPLFEARMSHYHQILNQRDACSIHLFLSLHPNQSRCSAINALLTVHNLLQTFWNNVQVIGLLKQLHVIHKWAAKSKTEIKEKPYAYSTM